MFPGEPITQTLRCTGRADSAGGSIQLLQLAITLREYQLPILALHWRNDSGTNLITVELTTVGPVLLLERLAERISTIGGVADVRAADPA